MTNAQKLQLAEILNYILKNEELHFEESGCNDNHIYALARNAWVEFQLDFQGE